MTKITRTDSKSIVLRSTHILRIEVLAAEAGPWVPSNSGFNSRKVDLSVRVAETLLGKLDPEPKQPMHFSVSQYGYGGLLMMQPLPGIWSPYRLAPGASFVVFANSAKSQVETLLVEPACLLVRPAADVLAGVRIAVQAEQQELTLTRTLGLAASEVPRLDPIFADFLWGKYADEALATPSEFDLLASFSEQKGLDLMTRQALLMGGYDLLGSYGDDHPILVRRLALAMIRVLLMPEASDLHENLMGTYLPNLLGITSESPKQTAAAVLKGHDAERSALRALLHRPEIHPSAGLLSEWLDSN